MSFFHSRYYFIYMDGAYYYIMFIAKIIELFEDAARNYRLQGSNLIKTLDLGVQYNYR